MYKTSIKDSMRLLDRIEHQGLDPEKVKFDFYKKANASLGVALKQLLNVADAIQCADFVSSDRVSDHLVVDVERMYRDAIEMSKRLANLCKGADDVQDG